MIRIAQANAPLGCLPLWPHHTRTVTDAEANILEFKTKWVPSMQVDGVFAYMVRNKT
jgi:hypothetical protein